MNKTADSLTSNECGRQADLVAYLYEEISGGARVAFEQHLTVCTPCRDELRGFQTVRREMGAWQVGFVPRVDLAPQKNTWQALRELIGSLPGWTRLAAAGALAAVAALVALSAIGTTFSYHSSDGLTVAFGRQPLTVSRSQVVPLPAPTPTPISQPSSITRAEAEKMIQEAVARAQAQSQQETRAQLASLQQRLNAEHQSRLAAVTNKLRNEQRVLLANLNRPSLREWLFAANEESESGETQNEKIN